MIAILVVCMVVQVLVCLLVLAHAKEHVKTLVDMDVTTHVVEIAREVVKALVTEDAVAIVDIVPTLLLLHFPICLIMNQHIKHMKRFC